MKDMQEFPVAFRSSRLLLRGVFHKPVGVGKFPSMVFCHGYFQSNRIGPMSLYVQIARGLAAHGIGCLRFDCAGFGESEGKYLEVSYKSLSCDLRNAVNFLKSMKGVDERQIAIVGHSLGGNIAIEVASGATDICGLCLLSPNPTSNLSEVTIFTNDHLAELNRGGITRRKGIPASNRVYRNINKGISMKKALMVKAQTAIVYGDKDPYYGYDQYLRLAKSFETKMTMSRVSNADHNFLPLESRVELNEHILSWSMNLFGLLRQRRLDSRS